MRRIRRDYEVYELRGARVRTAKAEYPCDIHACESTIPRGHPYAHISTGLRVCGRHWADTDVEDVP